MTDIKNKIPTAEEFRKSQPESPLYSGFEVNKFLIEFAKLHTKAALEAASEKAIAKEDPQDFGTGEIWVDKNSILNSYPENLIR